MEKNNNENHICRANIQAILDSDHDFEAVAVPYLNGKLMYSYQNDEYFNQVLRTGIDNINTERLASGIPLFDNHPDDNSASKILGITTGFEFTERGLVVKGKLGARADEALRSDIKNGIVKTVSIEGTVGQYSVERSVGKVPTYYAEKWTPESLSFAPVPNDIGAQIDVKRKLEAQIEKTITVEKDSFIKGLINKF